MGDTDDRIQKIETRLDSLDAQQQAVRKAAEVLLGEVRQLKAIAGRPSASPPIDGARLIERLDIIGGNLGMIVQKMR